MTRIRSLLSVIALLTPLVPAAEALAFAGAPLPALDATIELTAGGCGLGYHRGPLGGCQPNGYPAAGYGGAAVYRGGAYYGGGAVYRGGGAYYRGGGAVYRGGGAVYRGGGAVYRGGGAAYRGGGAYHYGGGRRW